MGKTMRYLAKVAGLGFLIGIALTIVLLALDYFSDQQVSFGQEFWKDVGITMLYSIVLTLINGTYFDYLNKRVNWKKYGRYRILIGAVGSIALTMMGIFGLRAFLQVGIERVSWEDFIQGERAVYYLGSLLITIFISVTFHAFYFYKFWQESRVKQQKIIAGTASAQFDALKNQLDPHFLFNSLNVLTSLIDEDPAQAQKFTTSLSKVYRYVLEQKNKDLVTVDEELQFAQTYVRLLKMRFENCIVFDIPEKSSNPEAKIVPLSLQLLLENAVKHNVVAEKRPLYIKVYEQENCLVVSNNLQEKPVVRKSSGVGLRNIRQRYGILTERAVEVRKSAKVFQVALPILTKQVSFMELQNTHLEAKSYQKAKERVQAIKGFYGNLTAYCIVIPFLIYLNFRTTSFPWAIFPSLGWGFGLTIHGLEVFGYNPLWGKRWEERKIRELMEKEDF